MECPHINQGQTVSLTLKDLTSIVKGGVKCGGMYISTIIKFKLLLIILITCIRLIERRSLLNTIFILSKWNKNGLIVTIASYFFSNMSNFFLTYSIYSMWSQRVCVGLRNLWTIKLWKIRQSPCTVTLRKRIIRWECSSCLPGMQ